MVESKIKKTLSVKQQQILDFVEQMVNEKGYPPSVREICAAVNLKSTSSVHAHLSALSKKGFIHKDESKTRALRLISNNSPNSAYKTPAETIENIVQIPVIGKVTAGSPILAVENIERTFPVPLDFISSKETFMLKVKGDSMIEAGILDNDYVLVSGQNTANNGDFVVALIEDEATIKTFYKEKDHFRLQPENQFLKPIIVKELIILGKITGVFRKL